MRMRCGLLALLLLTVPACGKSAPPPPPTAAEVFARAMKGMEAGSLASLGEVLSPAGADQVKRDLLAWKAILNDPAEGPRVLSRIPAGPAAPPAQWKGLIEKAKSGDLASLLSLYIAIDPHPASAALPEAPKASDAGGGAPPPGPPPPVLFLYRAREGSLRRVILTKHPEGWKVDLLTL